MLLDLDPIHKRDQGKISEKLHQKLIQIWSRIKVFIIRVVKLIVGLFFSINFRTPIKMD